MSRARGCPTAERMEDLLIGLELSKVRLSKRHEDLRQSEKDLVDAQKEVDLELDRLEAIGESLAYLRRQHSI